eukprot:14877644-Ditylum_brightwellii.AAC.1
MEQQMDLLVSTIAFRPSLRTNTAIDSKPGLNTSQLHDFISLIGLIDTAENITLYSSIQERAGNKNLKGAIYPGKVFSKMGEDW